MCKGRMEKKLCKVKVNITYGLIVQLFKFCTALIFVFFYFILTTVVFVSAWQSLSVQ